MAAREADSSRFYFWKKEKRESNNRILRARKVYKLLNRHSIKPKTGRKALTIKIKNDEYNRVRGVRMGHRGRKMNEKISMLNLYTSYFEKMSLIATGGNSGFNDCHQSNQVPLKGYVFYFYFYGQMLDS
jgi:hypothetical protein